MNMDTHKSFHLVFDVQHEPYFSWVRDYALYQTFKHTSFSECHIVQQITYKALQ